VGKELTKELESKEERGGEDGGATRNPRVRVWLREAVGEGERGFP